ncbi:hypothetical protein J2X47_000187 [Sphingomonas sp. BE270]|jgi:hypothetical protein|uniref:hypothetical protein n=1 Tax=Sphingomonas sp. BE270 TaxID=2817726 RepID=UPI00285C62E1|nr:hypothetical protein [Sphingomonas sp. BE270]MDR7256026.1 hypothetical protein [Sphingomonas sp. BE270]
MSDAPRLNDSIESIIGDAAAGEASAAALTPDDLKALADRVDLLTADFGRWESYKTASAEYIAAFKTEVDWHWRIRLAVSIACGLLVLFLATVLVVSLCRSDRFGADQPHALTALIVATVTGCVVVTIAVTKGAFATMADRNAGLPMPEHMKEIIEVGKNIIGGGHG